MKNKNLKSSKTQLLFFTAIPSILLYVGIALVVMGFLFEFSVLLIPGFALCAFGLMLSLAGGFICAANMSLVKAIGAPSRTVAKITIGRDKLSASLEMQFSEAQVGQFIVNLFFTALLTIPVAIIGWILFILYCKGKFLNKLRLMMIDLDTADSIIERGTAQVDDLAKCFYRMLDYVYVYKDLGEKKGANEMLDKAQKLLSIWEAIEAKNNS